MMSDRMKGQTILGADGMQCKNVLASFGRQNNSLVLQQDLYEYSMLMDRIGEAEARHSADFVGLCPRYIKIAVLCKNAQPRCCSQRYTPHLW